MSAIDTSLLPHWVQAYAINLAYTEAAVRLANAINLESFAPLQDYNYRITVSNLEAKEIRYLILKGQNSVSPTVVSFPDTISMMAILRITDYTVTFSGPTEISMLISGDGDMDRMYALFNQRPEFELFDLSQEVVYDVKKEEQKAQETNIQAAKTLDLSDMPPVRRPQRYKN